MAVLEAQAQLCGGCFGRGNDGRVVGLREQQQPGVVAEVGAEQLGVAIQAEALPDQRLEVLGEEVGEVERAQFGLVQLLEQLAAGEELVAVITREAPEPGRLGQQRVEAATGASVGIPDQHLAISRRVVLGQQVAEGGHDSLGSVVQVGRQVADLELVAEVVGLQHRTKLGDQGATREYERATHGVRVQTDGPGGSVRPRRADTSCLAVSDATAASRQ